MMHQKKLFNIYGATGGNFAGNVYDAEYIAPALSTMGGGKSATNNSRNDKNCIYHTMSARLQ